ncbi:MAG: cobalamin B12-binding domain-containing protein [Nitrospinae bacterium]|nr:cobalamin B12-binding domain-containing protein [Nitrospinota bacterium]
MSSVVNRFKNALLSLDNIKAREIILEVINQATPEAASVTIEELIYRSMSDIGEGWENDAVTLAQVYMSGRICETLMLDLFPEIGAESGKGPKMAITVLDDFHLLGKRIVKSILISNGFHLLDYGTTNVEQLVERVKKDGIQILLISVLMLPSALRIKELRKALTAAGLRPYIVVGGAPFRFDRNLYLEVGADATGAHAADAVGIVKGIISTETQWHSHN